MRLYEAEAKKIFRTHGVPVPEGVVATAPEEARRAAEELGGLVVVKAHVLIGGKGKAGGIRFAFSPDEAEKEAGELLGSKISGATVESVLIEERIPIEKELYMAVTIDRFEHKPVVMVSSEGGIEIEELAARSPEKIRKFHVEPGRPFHTYQARDLIAEIGLRGVELASTTDVLHRLYEVFSSYEAKLVELNPLAVTKEGLLSAVGSVMILDEDALFRHSEIKSMGIELRHDLGEMTKREKLAIANNIPYLDLDGYVGVFPGGAGFGITAIDLIEDLGGKASNFMDSGGGPSPERIAKMLELLVDNPKVVAIFGARFGGISRCDDFAKGVVMFLKARRPKKPIVMRMTGNKWKEGVEIFEKARSDDPDLFREITIYGIETPIEQVIKEAVEVANRELEEKRRVD